MLIPASFDHVTSFNYYNKNARDVDLTCWSHLSNIMPDSIFHESMRRVITCSVLFCLFFCISLFVCCAFFVGWYFCFPLDKRDGINFITITWADMGKSLTITDLCWWDWLACQGIQGSSIAEFLCLCMLCCFQSAMLHFYSIQSV